MRRIQAGEYQSLDGQWRIIHGFADDRGWTVLRLLPDGKAFEIVSAGWRTLRQAREVCR